MHHSPYSSENSSSLNGSQPDLQWPYEEWGADAVIASHDHVYERLFVGEIPYFVNGVGGRSVRTFGPPLPQSQFRYNAGYGAMLITADSESILYEFYSVNDGGTLIDSYRQLKRTTVISSGSVWRYLDDGSNQETAWKESGFDDSSWSSGAAQLGYGDGDEETVVSFGGDASNKPITTYFRHSFTVSNSAGVTALSLNLLRDDGAIVYLNGTEIVRSNLPEDTITYTTQALTGIAPADESVYINYDFAPDLLQDGVNVVAVEVHQNSPDSSDLSFDLSLSSMGISSPADTTAPSIPESFAGTAESDSQIDLSWQASTDDGAGVAGYRLFRDGVEVGTSSTINYTDTGLTAETAYSYTVAAYDAADPANESVQSGAVVITTLSSTSNPDTTAPSIPDSLAGTASDSKIDLSWQASTDDGAGVAGYRLFRDGVEIGTSSTTAYTDTGLTAETTYSYSIAAYDAADPANESAQSRAVIVKTLLSSTNDSDSDGGGALSILVLIAGLGVALLLRKRYQRVSAKT
ncbi:MAG: fibronectin type III domain-containing protein [Gammaproteobacteria bacterium]|nr:fibronectin type III domain-containing protein [Gammaproteobacteria bacterium]